MVFLILLLSAAVLGVLGGVLVRTMQQVRRATPYSDVRILAWGTLITGLVLLAVYGIPAVMFSGLLLFEAMQVGLDAVMEQHKEAIYFSSIAGVLMGASGISLVLVSLGLKRVQTEGQSMRNNVFALTLHGFGLVFLAGGFVLLTITTLIGGFLLALGTIRFMSSRREERQGQVLWTLTLAAEGQRPLARDLRDCATGMTAGVAKQVEHVADLLDAGYSLSSALESVRGLVPDASLLMIRMGEEAGDVAGALREATLTFTQGARRRLGQDQEAIGFRTGIVFCVVLAATIVTGFMMIFLVPKYKRIFQDFGVELPVMTGWLIDLSDAAMETLPMWIVPGLVVVGVLVYGAWMVLSSIDASRAVEWWAWGWLRPRVASGPILRSLSIVLSAGRPLSGALGTLAENFPCVPLRPKLREVAGNVSRGENVWAALERVGILRNEEVELLFAADRAGHLPWAVQELADGLERRAAFRLLTTLEVVHPALLLTVGLIVLWIDVAFFMPLVKLISDVS